MLCPQLDSMPPRKLSHTTYIESMVSSKYTCCFLSNSPLAFIAQGFVRDDPEKHHQGEDALFIARRGLGVADGVGGWSRQGIDSGEYSRSLMQHAFEYTQQHQDDLEVDPYEALEYAYKRTNVPGSTTAVIACGGRGWFSPFL